MQATIEDSPGPKRTRARERLETGGRAANGFESGRPPLLVDIPCNLDPQKVDKVRTHPPTSQASIRTRYHGMDRPAREGCSARGGSRRVSPKGNDQQTGPRSICWPRPFDSSFPRDLCGVMKPRHRPGLSTRNEANLSCWQIASFPLAVGLGLAASQASRGVWPVLGDVAGRVPGGCCSPLQGRGRTDGQMRAGSVSLGGTGTRNTSRLAGLLRAAAGSAACSVGRVPRPRKPARSSPSLLVAGCYRGYAGDWRPEQCARRRQCFQCCQCCCHHIFVISGHFLSLCVCIGSSDVACPPTAERRVGLGDAGCKHQACPAVVWWCASVVARGVRGVGGLGWCGGCQRREKHGSAPLIRQRAAGQCDGKSLVHVQHAARGAAASPDWLAHQDQPGSGAGNPQGLPR